METRRDGILGAAALALVLASPARAEEDPPRDVPVAASTPVVDGVLDDGAWDGALVVDDFVARLPVEGAAPTTRTEVRLAHDRRALYVAVRAVDPRPETVRATAARRDDFAIATGDQFVIAIDSFRDRRNGYWFSTNPLGARVDAQFSDEGDRFDDAWNGVWDAAARVGGEGWTAEIAIPWSTLRFREAPEVVMGINLFRRLPRTNEQLFAPAIPLVHANGTPNVSVARAYRFRDIDGGARLDVRPFALAAGGRGGPADDARSLDGGLFARLPLSDAVTLSGAFRADFSEVEADEDRLNLTRFSLFLPEKRDFFLENAGLFAFGAPGEAELFFSRRIGLVPGAGGADETVPVLWGAKAAGRAGPVEFGVLSGATGDAPSADGERFDVARARVVLGARSTVGAFWSRRGTEAGGRATAGADFSLFLPEEIRLQGFVAGTRGGGDDSGAWYVSASRSGERLAFTLSALDLSPGFDPALGLLARPGTRRHEASLVVPWFPGEASAFRRVAPGLSVVRYDDREGEGFDERAVLSLATDARRGWSLSAEVVRQRERVTSPFPLYRDVVVEAGSYERWEAAATFASDPARPLSGTVQVRAGSLYGGRHGFLRAELAWRPSRVLTFAPALYADRVLLPGAGFTAWVARARLGVTASARLSFDVLGQYESERRGAGVGLRVRYDFREGTQVLLAWDSVEMRDGVVLGAAPGGTRPERRSRAALKCSYLLQF